MMTRREGLRGAALTALAYSRVWGANDRVRLGLIGAGGRGQYVMTQFVKTTQVDVAAVCDVYGTRVDEALTKAPGARGFADHRKLLELKEVDVVLVGTPDHWHAGTTIDALNAGKDVYVEKPLTRTREEGPAIVRAARVNNRICQVGMQQRSGQVYLEAKERFFNSGAIGKVTYAHCFWDGGPPRALRREPAERPSNLDWARFLGPVKWREWTPGMYFNFRAFLDFGGGKLTDFGAHWFDVVHMMLNNDGPLGVSAAGGIYYDFKDGRTAPDSISALIDYPGFTVNFHSLALGNPGPYGIEFWGDKGKLFIDRNRYEFQPAEKGAPPVGARFPGDITLDHVKNFLECCRTRQLPTADAYIGHRSAQVALLANQAYLEKRRLTFDPQREEVLPL